jgi:hypothetical protein
MARRRFEFRAQGPIQSIIQPKIMADAANLSLTLTFLSLVFWAFVIGPPGAVLAVPLTLLTKALLLDVDPNTRWISSLVTGGLAPPEVAVTDVAPAPVTPELRDGDGPRPPAVERVTDNG